MLPETTFICCSGDAHALVHGHVHTQTQHIQWHCLVSFSAIVWKHPHAWAHWSDVNLHTHSDLVCSTLSLEYKQCCDGTCFHNITIKINTSLKRDVTPHKHWKHVQCMKMAQSNCYFAGFKNNSSWIICIHFKRIAVTTTAFKNIHIWINITYPPLCTVKSDWFC